MLTKLQAVNIVLDGIGEAAVSSLTSGLPDAEAAETKLNEVTTEVLAKGWHQNTETLSLNFDNNNEILVPSNYIRVDSSGLDKQLNVTIRTQNSVKKLYKVATQSYNFSNPLSVDVVLDIPFEELTIGLQSYIAHRAARKFQEATMGSVALDSFTARAEAESYAELLDAEAESEDVNILKDSATTYYATYRYHAVSGR